MDVVQNPQEDNEAHCLVVPEVSDKNAKKLKLGAVQVV
jgi:hypothetical protein